MKKGFVLYIDTYDLIKKLSQEEKGNLLDAVFDYASTGKVAILNPVTDMVFSSIKLYLDRDNEKWINTKKQRQIAGSKGGKQRIANQAIATFAKQDQANQAVNDSVNVKSKFFSSENTTERANGISLLLKNGY